MSWPTRFAARSTPSGSTERSHWWSRFPVRRGRRLSGATSSRSFARPWASGFRVGGDGHGIIREAERRAERRLKRARREAEKTISEARAEAEAQARKTLEAAKARADQIAQAILATVPQEAQRERLQAIEAQLSDIFDEALRRVREKNSYDYPAVDRPSLDEAWLGRLGERLGRQVKISIETAQGVDGGLVVRSADGRRLYDNTFGARLRRLRPEIRQTLARQLYSGERAAEADRG